MHLDILYDSAGVLAVAKPAGLATQAARGVPSVESFMRERLFGEAATDALFSGRRRHPGGFLGVPHRLDRAVSGVLLLATTPRAARQLSRQFERRHVSKTYLAVVVAGPTAPAVGETLTWHDLIRKLRDQPRAEIIQPDTEPTASDREAITTGRVRATAEDTMLLELHPRTGRMHQLRVQAAARGMPVLGDVMYGGRSLAHASEPSDERTSPIALHAWRIEFTNPETSLPIAVTCPPPAYQPWTTYTGHI